MTDPTATHLAGAPLATAGNGLEALLEKAGRLRFSGVVTVGRAGEVWLEDGAVYLANGPSSPSPFDVVLAAGVVSRLELQARWAAADATVDADPGTTTGDETTGRTGAVLDDLVLRTPEAVDALRRLLHEHTAAALFELLLTTGEPLELRAEARHVLGARFAEPVGDVLDDVRRRIGLWRRIAGRIPSTAARFRLARQLPGDRDRLVEADEWAFLALLDGNRTVADVITETGDSAFRVCALLYRFLVEQVIEPVPPPAG